MLAELQRAFVEAVLAPHADSSDALRAALVGDERLSAADRLAIYRSSVRGTLLEALAQVYPVLKRLVGEDFFSTLSMRYFATHRPAARDIGAWGDALPVFIEADGASEKLPWLPDLARLEWAWHQAFYADEAFQRLDIKALAEVPDAQHANLRFDLIPAVQLLRSDWPVHAIWEANQLEDPPDLTLDSGAVALVVARLEEQPEIVPVHETLFQLLADIRRGHTLGELAGQHSELPTLLPQLVMRGWLTLRA